MPEYFQPTSYIVDISCMDICLVDNNNGQIVRPWVTVAINPVCRTVYMSWISLEPPGIEERN